jgi:metal transporter CNNM
LSDLLTVALVAMLVTASGICSGLNISVMALDLADLKRKAKLGNKHARRVLPLRRNIHLLLGSILFTNVAFVSATSLVLGNHLNGWLAGLISTLLLVIFGEVFPQAIFSKNALAWTGRFYWLLNLMRAITYPASKPLQILLDHLFPRKRPGLQSRHELGLIIAEHVDDSSSELDEDEVEIMRGALQLSEKRVRDIMTDIRHTYWLTPGTELTPARIDELKAKGYSRIPVFNQQRTIVHGVMLMKDLVDIDFDTHDYKVGDFRLHHTAPVGSMTALDTMFRKFIAARSHLIPVEKDGKFIGIVTIEDLIEEILGHEIEDETDQSKLRAADTA